MMGQLILGTLLIVLTVMFHVASLFWLADRTRAVMTHKHPPLTLKMGVLSCGLSVFIIIVIHTIEAYAWASLYWGLGEFDRFQDALYFSVVTTTTLGYDDLTLSPDWRLLATFEAMGGLILFGVSAAFIIAWLQRFFEHRDSHTD